MNRQPLINAALIVALAASALSVLVAFGLGLTPDQIQALMGFVTVAAPLLVALLAHKKVTPLSDPRNSDGEQLVAVDASANPDVQPH